MNPLLQPSCAKVFSQTNFINYPRGKAENQQLLVSFKTLENNHVIDLRTVHLGFTITLDSKNLNATVVQNLGCAIFKKIVVKIPGIDVLSMDASDVLHTYLDLWTTRGGRGHSQHQDIDFHRNATKGDDDGNASKVKDKAIAGVYGNSVCIPLDFELLETKSRFYKSGLIKDLEYELTFNDNRCVILAENDPGASYSVQDVCLKYDVDTDPKLARDVERRYAGRQEFCYERVHRYKKITYDAKNKMWDVNIKVTSQKLKGVLMLFDLPGCPDAPFERQAEFFLNRKLEIYIDDKPKQEFDVRMRLWDDILRDYAASDKRNFTAGDVAKGLRLANATITEYLTSKYALWLDLIDDDQLRNSDWKYERNVSIQIPQEAEGPDPLIAYVFLIEDAQLILQDGQYLAAFLDKLMYSD